jgi:hypothetical protein
VHTNRSAESSGHRRNIALKSTDEDTLGILLLYRTCSTRVRSYRPNDHSYLATNHRAGIGSGDQMDQDPSLL